MICGLGEVNDYWKLCPACVERGEAATMAWYAAARKELRDGGEQPAKVEQGAEEPSGLPF